MTKNDINGKTNTTLKTWLLIWGLGLAGQLCWNIENQWFNTFVYAKIAKDPSIVSWMVAISAIATTFATFFFGTLADRKGTRKPFIVFGYAIWGIFTIVFGLTEFISKDLFMVAAVSIVVADMIMSFFGSMGNDGGFNAWTNDLMRPNNRGKIGGILAIQPVIGTIVGTLVGGMIIGDDKNYMLLFIVMGAAVMLFALLAAIFMKDDPSLKPHVQGTFWKQFASVFNFKKFFAMKELLLVNVGVTLFFIGFNVYFAHMGNYMIHYLGFGEFDMGLIQGISLVVAMLLVVPSTILINKKKTHLTAYISIALNIVGLLVLFFFVSPQSVVSTTAFSINNLVMFIGVFFVGAGYMVILQATTVWAKQLYPKESKGQFEGVRILFFVLFPMVIGSFIANQVIKIGGDKFFNPLIERMEYTPNGYIFLIGAIITVFSAIPFIFASKHYKQRIVTETTTLENIVIEDTGDVNE